MNRTDRTTTVAQPSRIRRRARSLPMLEALDVRTLLSTANVAGPWSGTLAQAPVVTVPQFTYHLDLTQSGANVGGTERLSYQVNTTQYFAVFNVSGTVTGNALTYKDVTIASQNTQPGFTWILKTVNLTVSADDNSMTGSWGGNANNQIKVTRDPSLVLTSPGAQ